MLCVNLMVMLCCYTRNSSLVLKGLWLPCFTLLYALSPCRQTHAHYTFYLGTTLAVVCICIMAQGLYMAGPHNPVHVLKIMLISVNNQTKTIIF